MICNRLFVHIPQCIIIGGQYLGTFTFSMCSWSLVNMHYGICTNDVKRMLKVSSGARRYIDEGIQFPYSLRGNFVLFFQIEFLALYERSSPHWATPIEIHTPPVE